LRTFLYIVVFVILCSVAFVWRASFGGVAWAVMAPFERARINLDASDNQRLRAELASTTALVADRNALYQENLQLKARLGRDANLSTILAGVLLHPPATPYDTLVVDAGLAEGVAQGDLVSAGGTTVIGTVTELYQHTSRITLFSAPGQTYQVLLRASIPVEMQGQGGGSLVGQVPAGTPVSMGDALLFPGIASQFAGSVSSVQIKEGQSFETLYAQLPVDPLSLQFVEIEKSYAGK
jgi:cell shape-determining protein MreC